MSRSADRDRVTSRHAGLTLAIAATLVGVLGGAEPARAQTPAPRTAPLKDAPFDRPRDSVDATGLTLPVRDLDLPAGRDLVFTVRSLDNSVNRTDSASRTAVSLSSDVLFAFGKATLTPAAGSLLLTVATEISAKAHGPVTITGHTDSLGTDAVNIPLSRARAEAVRAALQPRVTSAEISYTVSGKGSTQPIAPNTTKSGADNPSGRALNRRVTITFSTAAPVATG
jgi:outer membrane protein OmpA-like peptidoglycan-associated protein